MALSLTLKPGTAAGSRVGSHKLNVLLWVLQGLLAALFLMTGLMKLALPLEALTAQMQLPLPGLFVRFLGLCEFLGALGLILPGLLRVGRGLTPLAASGLVAIMVGATVITLASGGGVTALMPLVVGFLAAFVAFGRLRTAQRAVSASPAKLALPKSSPPGASTDS